MIVLFAFLLALAGMLLSFNGFVISIRAETIDAQILGAIYLVGGISIFGLALVAGAVRSIRLMERDRSTSAASMSGFQAVAAEPLPVAKEAVTAVPASAASVVASCVNCGRPINHRRKICDCGKSL